MFTNCVRHSRKVYKLEFLETTIDNDYIMALEKALGFDPKDTSDDQVLVNKGVKSYGEYFRQRVTNLTFS